MIRIEFGACPVCGRFQHITYEAIGARRMRATVSCPNFCTDAVVYEGESEQMVVVLCAAQEHGTEETHADDGGRDV